MTCFDVFMVYFTFEIRILKMFVADSQVVGNFFRIEFTSTYPFLPSFWVFWKIVEAPLTIGITRGYTTISKWCFF